MNCPDRKLLSVYADGELDSPWKQKVEAHIAGCPSCAGICRSYTSLSESLDLLGTSREKAVLARMTVMPPAAIASPPRGRITVSAPSIPFWRRPVALPFPVVTAAALVLTLATAFAIAGRIPLGNRGTSMPAIAKTVISAQPATFEALVRSIDAQGGDSVMTIVLPPEATIQSSGDPVLMTASTATGGNR